MSITNKVELNLLQQKRETKTINFVVIWMKTMTNLRNMSKASAPIHMTATSVK